MFVVFHQIPNCNTPPPGMMTTGQGLMSNPMFSNINRNVIGTLPGSSQTNNQSNSSLQQQFGNSDSQRRFQGNDRESRRNKGERRSRFNQVDSGEESSPGCDSRLVI